MSAIAEVVARSLRSYARPLLVWIAAMGAIGLVLALFWPAIRDATGLEELVANLPEAMRAMIGTEDLLSPAGFLNSRLNSIFPLLITIYAAFRITDETAGLEERGGFEVVLGTPLPRASLLTAKFVTVVICVFALMTATGLALVAGAAIVSMPLGAGRIMGATTALALVGTAFAGVTVAVAGITGRRGITLGTGAGLAVGLYFLYTFAPLVPALETLRPFTLFDQALGYDPLANGLRVAESLVLLAVAILGLLVGLVVFRRRDLHGT